METARNFYHNLPPPAECLAILLGVVQLTVTGLGGIANPIESSKAYGLPIVLASRLRGSQTSSEQREAADEAEKTQIALVSALAARNVRQGVLILGLACWLRDRRAVGLAVAVNVIASLADSLIVRWFGNEEKVSGHLIGVFGSGVIGSVLLRWRRDDPWW